MKQSIAGRMIVVFLVIVVVFLSCFWGIILYMQGLLSEEYTKNVSANAASTVASIEQSVNSILYSETALSADEDVLYLANTDYETIPAVELSDLVHRLKSKMRLVTPTFLVIRNIEIHFTRSGKTLSRMDFGDTRADVSALLENTRELLNDYGGRLYVKTLEFDNFCIACELDVFGFSTMLPREATGDFCQLRVGDIVLGTAPGGTESLAEGVHSLRQEGERYYLSVDEWGGARILNAIEASRIAGAFNVAIVTSLVTVVVITAAIAVYIVFVQRAIRRPLAELCGLVARLRGGEYGIALTGRYPGEFGGLVESVNALSARLAYLIDVEYKSEVTIRDMRLKQLQAQMNPHFLFNCFTLFRNLLHEKKFDLALELSEDLSLYFKTTITPGDTASLIDEMTGAKIYADIQNKREDGRISIVCEDPPLGLWAYTVPKFILQPIVENAFAYAFRDKKAAYTLRIACRDDGDYLAVDVFNDGAIRREEFEKIEGILRSTVHTEGMSALDNVNNRLRLFNRSERGVEASLSGGGLTVSLCLRRARCLGQEESEGPAGGTAPEERKEEKKDE